MSGTLYIVGTPIGNLEDISLRALRILRTVDIIGAEDTRVTRKLLNFYNIQNKIISYFEHNKSSHGKIIIDFLLKDKNCALVSDAGMPTISDPGDSLIRECMDLGISVQVVPGPSALISALSISGLNAGRFAFEGFLSVNKKSRKHHLETIKNEYRTMIFYEAPHKLLAMLQDLYAVLGERNISICRELTKIHEEVIKTKLSHAIELYKNSIKPRGEFVVVVEGKSDSIDETISFADALKMYKNDLISGISINNISKKIAKITNISKSEVYHKLLDTDFSKL